MGRIAAAGAVVLVVVVLCLLLLGGGAGYTVTADFQNASQIVSGDLVEVAGSKIGTVTGIHLAPDGEAELTLGIGNSGYAPLPAGTHATIREVSLSGVANRYVDLDLGPAGAAGGGRSGTIPNHGRIPATSTTSEVDIDELFNTLDAPTRLGLQNLIKGTAAEYAGAGREAQQAFRYLNPAVAAASTLFAEVNHDTASFDRFLYSSGKLMADISGRQSQLSGLISNLSNVTASLAPQDGALRSTLAGLPTFMHKADTTFANLDGTLDTLTPLVNAAKPVAPKLTTLLTRLQPVAAEAVPTFESLSAAVSKPGAANDLTDLVKLGVPLANASVNDVKADGATRRGAFPESTQALTQAVPELAFTRPYGVDLTGWFEGFSHPGGYDANGAFSRVAPVVDVASLNNGALNLLSSLLDPSLRSALTFNGAGVSTGNGDRCPGSMERGALYYPETGYACSPDEVPVGR